MAKEFPKNHLLRGSAGFQPAFEPKDQLRRADAGDTAREMAEQCLSCAQNAVLFLLRTYQATRFLRRPSCRFYPSCSHYMAGCIERHGVVQGFVLGLGRLLRCHPLHGGGVDEVPARFSWRLVRGA